MHLFYKVNKLTNFGIVTLYQIHANNAKEKQVYSYSFILHALYRKLPMKRPAPGAAKEKDPNGSDLFGGDGEDRTLDLLHAKQALSQLSYAPMDDTHYIIRFPFCKASSCRIRGDHKKLPGAASLFFTGKMPRTKKQPHFLQLPLHSYYFPQSPLMITLGRPPRSSMSASTSKTSAIASGVMMSIGAPCRRMVPSSTTRSFFE